MVTGEVGTPARNPAVTGVITLTWGTGFEGTKELPQDEQYVASSTLSVPHRGHFLVKTPPSAETH